MPAKLIDLTGRTYDRLTVIERAGAINGQPTWRCRCECGTEKVVRGLHLRSGNVRSCGCLRVDFPQAWKGDGIEYAAAHRRVMVDKGRATTYPCVDCGESAEEWSYVGGCPRERISNEGKSKGCAYSPDPDRYVARCRSCHKRHDLGQEAA